MTTPEDLFTTFTRTITETQKAAQLTEENIPKLAVLFKCTVDYSTGKPRLMPQGHPRGYGVGDYIGYMRTNDNGYAAINKNGFNRDGDWTNQ